MDRPPQYFSRAGARPEALAGPHCSDQASSSDVNSGLECENVSVEKPGHRVKSEPSSPTSSSRVYSLQDPGVTARSGRLLPPLSSTQQARAVSNEACSSGTLSGPAPSRTDQNSNGLGLLSSARLMKGGTSRGEPTGQATRMSSTVSESLGERTPGAPGTLHSGGATVKVKRERSEGLPSQPRSSSGVAVGDAGLSVGGDAGVAAEENRDNGGSCAGDSVARTGLGTVSAAKKGKKVGEGVGRLLTCDAAVVIIVDLHTDVWREGRYAFQKPSGRGKAGGAADKGIKQGTDGGSSAGEEAARGRCIEKQALKDFLSFLQCTYLF